MILGVLCIPCDPVTKLLEGWEGKAGRDLKTELWGVVRFTGIKVRKRNIHPLIVERTQRSGRRGTRSLRNRTSPPHNFQTWQLM